MSNLTQCVLEPSIKELNETVEFPNIIYTKISDKKVKDDVLES